MEPIDLSSLRPLTLAQTILPTLSAEITIGFRGATRERYLYSLGGVQHIHVMTQTKTNGTGALIGIIAIAFIGANAQPNTNSYTL